MNNLIVVSNPANWPISIPNAMLVSAKDYLTDLNLSQMRNVRVYNLCRSFRYQSLGYYVSLLAAARGHHPLPNVMTIQDMKNQSMIRFVSDELDELIQKSLASLVTERFVLSIYFGRNLAKKYDRLSRYLYNMFPSPSLRAYFVYQQKWQLQNIMPVPAKDIPEEHFAFLHEVAVSHFSGKRVSTLKRSTFRYDLAILVDPAEEEPPSNERAIQKFVKAAESLGIYAETITREDSGRLLEYDALFIRETTSVHHHTYRLARRAEAEGMAVIDDPQSILRCTNKVYLAELLQKNRIRTPQTWILHRDNKNHLMKTLPYPCILKQPDSSFSQGVLRVDQADQFQEEAGRLLEKSELVIAQAYVPTPFDWRIGILEDQPIFVCKYYMAGRHWQIIRRDAKGRIYEGKSDTLPVSEVPPAILSEALKATRLIGNGLYGVDVKEIDGQPYIIEVNDNPNVDAGVEDRIMGDDLYRHVMQVFLNRIERGKKPV